jgi:hypothetical protein
MSAKHSHRFTRQQKSGAIMRIPRVNLGREIHTPQERSTDVVLAIDADPTIHVTATVEGDQWVLRYPCPWCPPRRGRPVVHTHPGGPVDAPPADGWRVSHCPLRGQHGVPDAYTMITHPQVEAPGTTLCRWRLDSHDPVLPILWPAPLPRRRQRRDAGPWFPRQSLHRRPGRHVRADRDRGVDRHADVALWLHRPRVRGLDRSEPAFSVLRVRAMSTIAVDCRRCGQEFEPGREAIVAGTWRLCPACRGVRPTGPAVCPHCHKVLTALRESGARERR